MKKKYLQKKPRFAHCSYKPGIDKLVEPNLAVTPSQMMRMTEQGVAVSSQLAGDFNDGEVNPAWDLPIDSVRGVDIVDTWEAQRSARMKIKIAHDTESKKYPNDNLKSV